MSATTRPRAPACCELVRCRRPPEPSLRHTPTAFVRKSAPGSWQAEVAVCVPVGELHASHRAVKAGLVDRQRAVSAVAVRFQNREPRPAKIVETKHEVAVPVTVKVAGRQRVGGDVGKVPGVKGPPRGIEQAFCPCG